MDMQKADEAVEVMRTSAVPSAILRDLTSILLNGKPTLERTREIIASLGTLEFKGRNAEKTFRILGEDAPDEDVWEAVKQSDQVQQWLRGDEPGDAEEAGEYTNHKRAREAFEVSNVSVFRPKDEVLVTIKADVSTEFQDKYVDAYLVPFVRDVAAHVLSVGVVVVRIDRVLPDLSVPYVVPFSMCQVVYREGPTQPREYMAIPNGALRRGDWDHESAIPNAHVFVVDPPSHDGQPSGPMQHIMQVISRQNQIEEAAVRGVLAQNYPIVVGERDDQRLTDPNMTVDQVAPGDALQNASKEARDNAKLQCIVLSQQKALMRLANGRRSEPTEEERRARGEPAHVHKEVMPPGIRPRFVHAPREDYHFIESRESTVHEICRALNYPYSWLASSSSAGRVDYTVMEKRTAAAAALRDKVLRIVNETLELTFGDSSDRVEAIFSSVIPMEKLSELHREGQIKWSFVRKMLSAHYKVPEWVLPEGEPVPRDVRMERPPHKRSRKRARDRVEKDKIDSVFQRTKKGAQTRAQKQVESAAQNA